MTVIECVQLDADPNKNLDLVDLKNCRVEMFILCDLAPPTV